MFHARPRYVSKSLRDVGWGGDGIQAVGLEWLVSGWVGALGGGRSKTGAEERHDNVDLMMTRNGEK